MVRVLRLDLKNGYLASVSLSVQGGKSDFWSGFYGGDTG